MSYTCFSVGSRVLWTQISLVILSTCMGLPRPGRPFRDGVICAKRRDRQIIAVPRRAVLAESEEQGMMLAAWGTWPSGNKA